MLVQNGKLLPHGSEFAAHYSAKDTFAKFVEVRFGSREAHRAIEVLKPYKPTV